ncbi:MAG: hypothetical protein DI551_04060 [Micavibrio aeruginosavorus]|uniref:Filamentous haemagglutinin FhaB/tRNA nuclease CdiA-like TPS domain-containing protein n=1 Tax=Micavibrio aeruginosavorus TaxID=349221 RepID=A0A2W5Q6N9_9BACT|nr:MAG: hypothetical protein DI551_04060 [Micavibrio aeruginosavorus]
MQCNIPSLWMFFELSLQNNTLSCPTLPPLHTPLKTLLLRFRMAFCPRLCRRAFLHTTALVAVVTLGAPLAHAEPSGGSVTAGNANISSSGTTTTINQSSNRAIIRWDSFDVGAGEHVRFNQPSTSSITVNRIRDTKASSINGKISANGNIVLINPNGLVFGSTATVDVGGLVATTSDLDDDNAFMAGGAVKFTKPGKADARIINNGQMTVREGGLVGLVAPHVENHGIIEARLGKVQLASGDIHTIDFAGDGLIKLEISDDVYAQSVTNTGTITADGGSILLTAAQARSMVDTLVTNTGTLRANTVTLANGTKRTGSIAVSTKGLQGLNLSLPEPAHTFENTKATVFNTGTMTANGTMMDEIGGDITILADLINLGDGTVVEATGDSGGGSIRVGGDYQGGNGIPTSDMIYVSDQAILNAGARRRGDGGRIILWSDQNTRFYGSADASGGLESGDGGLIEVSSKGFLDFSGATNLGGDKNGTLLLDPTNIVISTGSNAAVTGSSPFTPNADDAASVLNIATLQAALASGNVIVQTRATGAQLGTITLDNALSWSSGNTLTLDAHNAIILNAAIAAGSGSLTMIAGADVTFNANITGTGTITIQQASDGISMGINGGAGVLNLSTADLTRIVDGWGNIVLGRSTSTAAVTVAARTWTDNVTFLAGTGGVNITGSQTMGANSLTVTTANGAVAIAGVTGTGNITVSSGGANISVGSAISTTGTVSLTSGGGTISNSATIGSGALTMTSGGGAITIGAAITAGGATNINSGAGAMNINAALSSGTNALTLGSAGSNITSNASGAITGGVTNITTSGGDFVTGSTLTTSGTTTINTGAGLITLGGATNSATNALSLTTTARNITTAGITSGALTINSNDGNISTGTITASGTVSLTSGLGSINVGTIAASTNAVSLTASNNTITTTAITSGALTVGSGGGVITFNGAIAASGTTGITSGGAAVNVNAALGSGTGAMTITTSGGTFTKANTGALTSAALTITTTNGNISIGTGGVTTTGTITWNSGTGSIGVNSAINSGTSAFSATATGNTITLTTVTSGAITLNSGGANISTGAITASGIGSINAGAATINIGAISTGTNALTLTTVGFGITTSTITSGALTVGSGGGVITFNGAVAASGTTGITSGGAAVNANAALGSGTGAMTITTSGGTFTKANTGALTSAALNITTANGNISIGTGGVTATGIITLNSGTGSVAVGSTMSSGSNALNVTTSNNTINLATVTSGGATIGSGGGAITLGAMTSGATSITTAGGLFTLNGNSTFSGNLSISTGAGNVVLNNSITTTTATTTITTTGGSINKVAAINTTSGAISLTSGGGAITIGTGGITASSGATINLSSGTGVIAVNTVMNSGTGSMNITTDADLGLNIANALTGSGNLTISQATAGKSIAIGAGTADVMITATEQGRIVNGWGNIIIGRTDGSAAMAVDSFTWQDSLTLRTGSGVITLAAQTFGNNSFTISTDADIAFTGVISGGTGNFIIQPSTASTTIGVGTGQTGTIAISDTEIGYLTSNWSNVYFGNTSQTGAINVGTATWSDPINFRTGTGLITINGNQTMGGNSISITSNTDMVFNANITGTGTTTIAAVSGSTTTMGVGDGMSGTIYLTSTELAKLQTTSLAFGNTGMNGAINVGAYSGTSNISYISAAGVIYINGAQTLSASRSLTITTNANLVIGANISGTSGGTFTLNTSSNSATIGVGDSQSGAVNLTDTELAFIQDGWGNIIFGSTNQTGTMNIGAYTWTDNVQFRANTATLNINGDQNLGANNLIIMSNTTPNLNGDLIGTGTLTLRSSSNGTSMGIGNGQAGTVKYDDTMLTRVSSTWGTIVFGHTGLTAALGINIGAENWASNITFTSDTGPININGAQTLAAGKNLTFSTNGDPTISAGLSGTGILTFQTASTGTGNTIGIGDGQAGTLQLSNNDLGNVLNGWSQIAFGSTGMTDSMNIGAYTWQYDTIFRTGSGVITVAGEQITERNMTFESASNIVIGANLTGSGILTFRGSATNTSVGVAGGTGTMNISAAELAYITDGWSKLVFGRSDSTTTLNINAYASWADNVQFINGTGILTLAAGSHNFGANNLTISANSNVALTGTIAGTGNLVVEGSVATTTIGLAGGAGTLALTAAELNNITDGWASLMFGSITGTGVITTGAYTWKDNLTVISNGNVTVSGLQTATAGTSLTYVTLAGIFTNSTGSATPITAGTGARYLIYSVKASSDSYGSFVPPAPALTQKSYFNYAPGSVVETGNRILYSDGAAKILYLQIDNKTKVYGDTLPTYTYTYLGGLQGGDTINAALTAYTLTALGASATDDAGTSRAITGNFTTALGYSVQVTDGLLTVTKAPILVTTGNVTQAYGDTYAGTGINYIGLRNGETSAVIDTLATATSGTNNLTSVGTYTITVSGAADNNYTFNYAPGTLTINPAVIYVTTQNATREYGLANPALSYVYSGFKNGQDQTVFTSQATAATIAVIGSNAGDYAITASGAAATNYTFNYVDTGVLSVTKATLTATTQNATRQYGDADPTLSVVYTGFRNGDTASVVTTAATMGSTATATSNAGGVYYVTASAADSTNYIFNYVNSGVLTITKATLTATTQNINREYGLANTGLSVVYTGFKNGEDDTVIDTLANVTSAATTTSNAGTTFAVTASGASDNNYSFTYANTGVLTVTKAMLTATTQDATREYGVANPTFSVVYTGFRNGQTQSVIGTLATASTTATAVSGVNTYAITASGAVATNYDFTYANTGVLTVTKATLTATTQNATRVYGDADPTFSVVYTGFKNGEDTSVISTLANITSAAGVASDVGSYTISSSGADAANYQFNYVNSGNLSITKATLTATTQNFSREYGAANTGVSVVYTGFRNSDDDTVINTLANVTSTATTTSNAGTTYAVTASGASDNNYNFTYVNTGVLTVTKAMLTATTQNATRQYGLANPTLSVVYTGFKNGQTQSVIGTLATATTSADITSDVGTYGISSSGAVATNYDFTYVDSGILSITKATLTATTQDATREYGLANPTLSVIYTGFRNGDDDSDIDTLATATTSADLLSNVGSYAITSSGAFDNNYQFSYANTGNLSVTKATLTATTQDATREYGSANPTFSVVYTGFRNGEDDTVINTLASTTSGTNLTSNVGTYTISASGASDNNYQFSYANTGQLEITKAMLTATTQNATRQYGLANPTFSVVYTGFKNGQTQSVIDTLATAATTADITSDVGTYGISASGALDNNYDFTYVDTGILSITKATLTATTQNATREYGLANPTLSVVYTGFRNGDDDSDIDTLATPITSADLLSNVGSYAITSSGADDNNYQFVYANTGNLSVTKATLTATTQNATREYGLANTGLLSVVYTGFRNGDDETVINTLVNVASVAVGANVGTYAVNASGGSDNNYQFAYANSGQLVITKATLNVAANNQQRETDEPNPILTATYSGFRAGDNVSDIDTLATITTTAMANSPIGTYSITANGASDNNYLFTYTPGTFTIVVDAEAPPPPPPPPPVTQIPSTADRALTEPLPVYLGGTNPWFWDEPEYLSKPTVVFMDENTLFSEQADDYLIAISEQLRRKYHGKGHTAH